MGSRAHLVSASSSTSRHDLSMTTLLLVRHGQIKANVDGCWHGSTDSPLTWRGRRQANRTARHLAQLPDRPTHIYSSPLERCRHTATQIGQRLNLEPTIENDLREYAIGDWEGMRFADLAAEHDFVSRAIADPHFTPPGGESLAAVAQRMSDAVHELQARHADETDARLIIVSHGAAMAVMLGQLLHDAPHRWTDYHFANCSVTELVLSPAPYVNFFNSTQHL
jgi:broad specificity phosphatase PhoE